MNAPSINEIGPEHLEAPLEKLLGAPVTPISWRVEEMKGGVGNPVSMGLYRVSGRARAAGEERRFTMVLKAIQSPANIGQYGFGEGDDPHHWNYWQREPRFYESELVDLVPTSLIVPACYAIHRWADRIIWMWFEAIEGEHRDPRTPEELAIVARALGCFNGTFVGEERLPDAEFLGRETLPQWLDHSGWDNALIEEDTRPRWEHPLMRALFTPQSPYRRWWDDFDAQFARLATVPRTWCHGDGSPTNFKLRPRSDGEPWVVALDWALSHIGLLGEDVAMLVYSSYEWFAPDEQPHVAERLFAGYLDGLRDAGWYGDAGAVRQGFIQSLLIRYSSFYWFVAEMGIADRPASIANSDEHRAAARFFEWAAGVALKEAVASKTHR